ncbi:hypothetical protein AXX17_AT4G13200 [Arabidopsis thaliana]|uniref:Plasma membrane ATPase n=1 Tax=Arabidopsis thaliana TaxID=3702 RepID=A0A178UWJ5_ARATH|nr:hypothetical protein AXX17_AT4G13200 [Arabidopsis thaliana]
MATGDSLEDIKIEIDDDLEKIPIEEVFKKLRCSREGLSGAEGKERLKIFGPNKLENKKKEHITLRFFALMFKPLSWVIQAAAIMAMLFANGDGRPPSWQLFLGIVCLLIVNTIICYLKEDDAENVVAMARAGLSPKTKVLRDGKWSEQEASILVPGDIVSIKLGDIIPCDARLLEGHALKVDESALTGEFGPITKGPGEEVFSGTTCKHGEMEAVVIATGVHTFSGTTAHLVDNRTNKVGHFLKVVTEIENLCVISIAIGISIELIVMYWIQRRNFSDVINNLLVLVIGGIPLAMPTVLYVIMVTGSLRLYRTGTITQRITAIEDMAAIDVLCSDKTGTLTLNKLSVDKNLIKVYSKDVEKEQVLLLAARASRTENGDGIDAAMVGSLADPKETRAGIREVHFNVVDKRTALTYIDSNGDWHRVSKGTPEQILDLCNVRDDLRKSVHSAIGNYAERGLKSLAVARQNVPEKTKESSGGPWEFVGLLPLFDPPRHDSAETIKRALDLGVNMKMITGDNLTIAKETGRRLGMGTNMYPITSLLGNHKDDIIAYYPIDESVDGFSGVFPEHKYHIVNKLQERHICGMIGDGVDDVPSLKKADVGIAVAGASEAARAASDIVLTEPGLSVIIDAVLASRATLQQMKHYTIYAVSITIRVVFGFMFIALIWKFDFSPFMVLAIALLNEETTKAITMDNVTNPSPTPDSLKLKEIFATGVVYGSYMALITVVFFWAAYRTDIFPRTFHVRDLRGNEAEMMCALYLQVSIMSQALFFVIQSRSWFFVERPGELLFLSFVTVQTIATTLAVYASWETARIEGIGWSWAGVIWLYNIIFFFPLDIMKFGIRYILTGKAQSLFDNMVHLVLNSYAKLSWRILSNGIYNHTQADHTYSLLEVSTPPSQDLRGVGWV